VLSRFATALLLLLCPAVATYGQEADVKEFWPTRSGYYRVSYTSDLSPVTINRIHHWIFHVDDSTGKPVENANVSITGGMPEHNHGLPTNPQMTESRGGGDYVLEGMRFHMSGYWELTVTVEADGRRDTVVIPLTI